jgi:hypothetical protein
MADQAVFFYNISFSGVTVFIHEVNVCIGALHTQWVQQLSTDIFFPGAPPSFLTYNTLKQKHEIVILPFFTDTGTGFLVLNTLY